VHIYLSQRKSTNRMKSNFYILLILLLSFSFANAQETTSTVVEELTNIENNVENSDSEFSNEILNSENTETTVNKNEEESNNTNDVIVKSSSDIRIYLNKERNVENIDLIFPKVYKKEVV
jgi:hypothetical protein